MTFHDGQELVEDCALASYPQHLLFGIGSDVIVFGDADTHIMCTHPIPELNSHHIFVEGAVYIDINSVYNERKSIFFIIIFLK